MDHVADGTSPTSGGPALADRGDAAGGGVTTEQRDRPALPSSASASGTADPAPRRFVRLRLPRPGPRAPGQDRLRALDGLRILAALMVCLFHYAGKGGAVSEAWGEPPDSLFPHLAAVAVYGKLGVQLFFVISGFVICMSCWGRTPAEFFRSRVARLYPAYWVAIALTTAACLVLPNVAEPLRLNEILVNLTMLQQPMGVPRVLGVCWTLWVEARFYLLFALFVVWKGTSYRRVVLFCCLWTVAGLLARVAKTPLLDEIVMREHAPFFIGGLALYLIHRFGSDLLLWGIVVVSWLLGQRYMTSALTSEDVSNSFLDRSPYAILLVVTLAFGAVAAVALGWLSWADWRWLTVAGALTYPFYLVHEHLGWFAIRVLHHTLDLPARPTMAVTAIGMLVLAWLIHRFVERPLGPRMKRALIAQGARVRARAQA